MSTVKIKNIKQMVINSTVQPLKLGGVQDDGSDAKITIDTNGNTSFSQVTGIKFPATQVPSSDANTLDDYEEGTWTTSLSSDSGAITSFVGSHQRYTKIGNVVTIALSFQITNAGTASGNLYFSLPFYCTYNASGAGRIINTGHTLSIAGGSSSTAYVLKYDASSPFGNYIYHISMTYITT